MFIAIVEVAQRIRSQMLVRALVALWRFMACIALMTFLVFIVFVCQAQVCLIFIQMIIQVSKGLESWLPHLASFEGYAIL